MSKYLIAGLAIFLVMALLDALWLGWLAKSLYQEGVGHLMSERPNWLAAVAFYVIFVSGLMVFAVMPHAGEAGWIQTAISAAFFGFVAYATYDLSNLATLRGWPVQLSLIDMVWGSFLSATSASAGKLAMDHWMARS